MNLFITYKNHRNEEAIREIKVTGIRLGTSNFYKTKQWLVEATDMKRNVIREFALDRVSYFDYPDGQMNGPNENFRLLNLITKHFNVPSVPTLCMVCDEGVKSIYSNIKTGMSGHKSCIKYLPEDYIELFKQSKQASERYNELAETHKQMIARYSNLIQKYNSIVVLTADQIKEL